MARRPSRLPWSYDDQRQEFTTPAGKVTLHELAALRYGLATSRIDLAGPWAGWRLRGAVLKSPQGAAITVRPEIAAQFARWLREIESRESGDGGQVNQRTHLRLVK